MLSKPFAELIQADDIVAMVVHLWRRGNRNGRVLSEEAHSVIGSRSGIFETRGIIPREPAWEELVDGGGFDDVPRNDVGADFTSFFKEEHTEVLIASFIGELLKANGGAEAGWTCVDRSAVG